MTVLNFNLFYIIPMMSIWSGLLAFSSSHKHLLNMLISLEFIMLNIFWFMTIILSNFSNELFLILFVLTLNCMRSSSWLSTSCFNCSLPWKWFF